MAETQQCSGCGAQLAPDAPGGHCLNCLLQLGMISEPEVAAPEASDLEPLSSEAPVRRIGRYRLQDQIGEGGCGVVYVAEQVEPVHRFVALKIVKPGMDSRQIIARFEAERQALALMDHPNIARILDAGTTESGRPYFVMELVQGVKITQYCDQHKLSTTQRLELFIQVCHAVQHAHQKGIIHRDLKPPNILVNEEHSVAVPKVIDFGIAKAIAGQVLTDRTVFTAFEQFLGTPAYMSPEQAELGNADIDTRSDIYSLGILLYELLTGHTPFDTRELIDSGLDALRKTIREKEPPRPSTKLHMLSGEELNQAARCRGTEPPKLAGLLRGDLDWIVMKCLEKERTRRYETANGLARDIQRHLSNEPVLARPPSQVYRFQKLVRRNKLLVAAAGAVMAALVAGLGISTWLFIRESKAHELYLTAAQDAQRAQMKEAQQRKRAEAQAYIASMNLVQQAWERNDVERVRELLRQTAAYPTRGFEWYYWFRRAHQELSTLHGHLGAINAVAFSPNGQRILTAGWDTTAKVWDAESGRELFTLQGHSSWILCAAFSPDGRRIVTAGRDRTAKVWNADSGQELVTLRGHNGRIFSVAFSPDGRRIATASSDSTARIWDSVRGNELVSLGGNKLQAIYVAFLPDGQRAATFGYDGQLQFWDVASGKELHARYLNSQTTAVSMSPDGRRIITAMADGSATVWDANSGQELRTLKGNAATILSVAFSSNGRRIVTGDKDHSVKVWDADDGTEMLIFRGHIGPVFAVSFSPDGKRLVSGSTDFTAKVWEATDRSQPLTLNRGGAPIGCVAFSPNGQQIATGGLDPDAKIWDAATGDQQHVLKGHRDVISSVAFSPDGRRIVTGSSDRTAKIWETASGNFLRTLEGGHVSAVTSVAFSPDGRLIVTGGNDRIADIWDAAEGKPLRQLKGHLGQVTAVAFSPNGRRILTGSADGTARVWDAASGQPLMSLPHGWVLSVAFSPDGGQIATADAGGTAKLWNAFGHQLRVIAGHRSFINPIIFSPDGRRIFTGGGDSIVKLWDVATGNEVLALNWNVNSAAFSADGHRLVTGSGDTTVNVWETASAEEAAAWEQEEEKAADQLAVLQSEHEAELKRDRELRTHDAGAIKQWLLLAPIPFEGQSGATALNLEQTPHESALRPKPGVQVQLGTNELVWKPVQLEDYFIDFSELLAQPREWCVAYAVCYLQSDTDRGGLMIKVGSDDQSKIYLNGKEIYRSEEPRDYIPDENVVTGVSLKAGANVLVFKVVNQTAGWAGSIRFTDAAGQPVKGLRVTLTPPEEK